MRYEKLLKLVGSHPWFDLATLVQLSGEPRQNLRVQLYRWCKAGMLIPLKRGMYAIAEPYRHSVLNIPQLANQLLTPSYISTYWALSYYGIIPEKVVLYTNITTRSTKTIENSLGVFQYRHLKQPAFWGYKALEFEDSKVMIADPEKALLDLWYLHPGAWDLKRMKAMRFQSFELVDADKLKEYAQAFDSPRLYRAIRAWMTLAIAQATGAVEL